MAKDVTKKAKSAADLQAANETERKQLIKIVQDHIQFCNLKSLQKIAKTVGAHMAWVAPDPR